MLSLSVTAPATSHARLKRSRRPSTTLCRCTACPSKTASGSRGNGDEVIASAGEILFEEGAPAEHMVLILKGEIHVRRHARRPHGAVHRPRRPNDRPASLSRA